MCVQDMNITESLLVIFCSCPLLTVYKTICIVLRHFAHSHWGWDLSEQTFWSQVEVIIETHWTKSRRCKEKVKDDTRMGRTGHISSLMDHCLFRCSCWTGKQHPKHESDDPFKHTFPISFILVNQKAKGRHFTPTVCLMRMPGVSRDTFEREKDNGFLKLRPNQNKFYHPKCYPHLLAYISP